MIFRLEILAWNFGSEIRPKNFGLESWPGKQAKSFGLETWPEFQAKNSGLKCSFSLQMIRPSVSAYIWYHYFSNDYYLAKNWIEVS